MTTIFRIFFFIVTFFVLSTFKVSAVPVYPFPVKLYQPDGKPLTIVGHGDEYYSYLTTLDGYTVIKDVDRYYHYAKVEGDQLVATEVIAHDDSERTSEERAFLSANSEQVKNAMEPVYSARRKAQRQIFDTPDDPATPVRPMSNPNFNKEKFRGLLILVNFNDAGLRMGNEESNSLYTSMMNDLNYTGYEDRSAGFQRYTGSVRDYFNDNTFGQFAPEFDVIGPVDINYSMYDAKRTTNSRTLATAALKAADPYVDYKKYDADGDGTVDMFYIIYAGHSSNYSGNDERLLWPHATSLYTTTTLDGMKFGRYACSTELYGWDTTKSEDGSTTERHDSLLSGIGTVIHEFSHVLGYEDHYDTSKGGHENPKQWDVMANGSYLNKGITPCGYNAYEMYSGGFIKPIVINDSIGSTLALQDLAKTGQAYRINNTQKKVYFLLENRQKTKWDAYMHGSGMLIWRVDSTSSSAWTSNKVNVSDHLYFQLLRANAQYDSEGELIDSESDPFPGKSSRRSISNETKPNLLSYTGMKSSVILSGIVEKNGLVSFNVKDANGDVKPEGYVFYEGFAQCLGGGGNDGDFSSGMVTADFVADNEGWTYNIARGCDNCARFGNNTKIGTATTPSFQLEEGKTYTLSFTAGPYYTDKTAMTLSVASGNAVLVNDSVQGDVDATTKSFTTVLGKFSDYSFTIKGSGDQKLTFKGGTRAYRFILDEVLIKEKKELGFISGDANGDGEVSVSDLSLIASYILGNEVTINLKAADLNADGEITVSDISQLATIILGQ